MYALNNVTTQDNYTQGTTLVCPQTIKVNITIANAAAFVQMADPSPGIVGGGGAFRPELFMPPGYYNMTRRVEQVRVRSALAGAPAQVTIEALTPHD
jgi:hypothetical protein